MSVKNRLVTVAPRTPRRKIWAGLMTILLVFDASGARSTAGLLGDVTAVLTLYLLPIVAWQLLKKVR